MSAAIKTVFKLVSPLFSPKFYKTNYDALIVEARKPSMKPFFVSMGAVAAVGYIMKYVALERPQILEKQKVVKKALEGFGHH
mmetsp:Transcript_28046/g.38600  ORF Transcript_28046/g.38600 Transcript_28046/m.38600 type:complete len:82 (-) Transcript_28046:102-347(-)